MKYGIGIIATLSLVAGCAAMAAQQRRIDNARSACYQQDAKTVYQETYAVLSGIYPIAKESERRGYIATDWAEVVDAWGNKWQQQVNAEIIEGSCNRVTIRMDGKTWDVNTDAWTAAANVQQEEDRLYVEINKRIMQHASAAPTAAAPPAPRPAATNPQSPARRPAPQPASTGPAGQEGGPCYGNGSCNQGLTCASNLCVDVNPQ